MDSVALMASEEHGGQGSRALRITPPSKPAEMLGYPEETAKERDDEYQVSAKTSCSGGGCSLSH